MYAFAQALLQTPPIVLAIPLRQYSLGHEMILGGRGNLLLADTQGDFNGLPLSDRIAAIIEAVDVCSQTWAENQFPPRGWRARRRARRNWQQWGKYRANLREEDYLAAIEEFQLYRYCGSTFPPSPDPEATQMAYGKEENGRQLGGELHARLLNFLLPRWQLFGYESVYDVPFGVGLHLYFTDLEALGARKIENALERQLKEEMIGHRKYFAEKKAAAAAALAAEQTKGTE